MIITLLSAMDFSVIQESVKVSSLNLQEFLQNALEGV
jgi:hypothetical protein